MPHLASQPELLNSLHTADVQGKGGGAQAVPTSHREVGGGAGTLNTTSSLSMSCPVLTTPTLGGPQNETPNILQEDRI